MYISTVLGRKDGLVVKALSWDPEELVLSVGCHTFPVESYVIPIISLYLRCTTCKNIIYLSHEAEYVNEELAYYLNSPL